MLIAVAHLLVDGVGFGQIASSLIAAVARCISPQKPLSYAN